jgi:hypothetical protein
MQHHKGARREIPNSNPAKRGTKFQINSKNQNQMTETFGTVRVWSLEFEYWNLFGAWDLVLLDYWDLEFSA